MAEKSPRGEERMKHYETIFIANPNLGDEDYGDILTKFRDSIEKLKGVIIRTEEWGKQKLAYQLKKFDNGFYVLIEYCGEPGMTAELERNLNLDERILKYQTVKLADKADPEALIQKERETREKSRLKAAETSKEEISEESPEEEGVQGEVVPEVVPERAPEIAQEIAQEIASESVETAEKESEEEGPADAAGDLVNTGEAQKEERKEGPQGTEEAVEEETAFHNEGKIED
jgi:small subunit ribosomal protein S6